MRMYRIAGVAVSVLALATACKKEDPTPSTTNDPTNPNSPIVAASTGWETLGSAKRRSSTGINIFYGAKALALGADSLGQVGVAYEESYNLQQGDHTARFSGFFRPGDTLALKPNFPFTQENQVDFTYQYRYIPGTSRLYQSYYLVSNATSFPSYRIGLMAEPVTGAEDISFSYSSSFADFHTLPVLTNKDEVMMAGTKSGNSMINGAYTDSFYNYWPRRGTPEIGRLLRYSGYFEGSTRAHNAVRLPSGKIISLLSDNGARLVLGQLPVYGGASRVLTEIVVQDTAGIGLGYANYAKRVGDAALFTYLAKRGGSTTVTCFRYREGETTLTKVYGPVALSMADNEIDSWVQDDQGQLFGHKTTSTGDQFVKLGASGLQTVGSALPVGYNAAAFTLSGGYLYTLVAPIIGGQTGMKNRIDLIRTRY